MPGQRKRCELSVSLLDEIEKFGEQHPEFRFCHQKLAVKAVNLQSFSLDFTLWIDKFVKFPSRTNSIV